MSEVALISARKSRLSTAAKKGSRNAATALKLSEEPDRFLSTVQIGITLIGILTGLFSGAALSSEFAAWLASAGLSAATARVVAQTVIVIIVTYLSIVVGELFPKRIGLNASDRVAMAVARPMHFLSVLTLPAVWLLSRSTSVLVNLFGLNKESNRVTEEEVKSVIREGTDAGEVKDLEQNIMLRALAMGDQRVSSIMTPKIDLVTLDASMSPDRIKEIIREDTHSCYPLYDADHESIIGIVHLKDIIFDICNDSFNLSDAAKPGTFIPEIMQAYDALDILRNKGVHCGLVCDEYGEVQGMVTLCDVLSGLVGSVEVGKDDAFIIERADGHSWLVDGQCPIYDFMLHFDLDGEEIPAGFTTIAGLILDQPTKILNPGAPLTYQVRTLESVDIDGVCKHHIMVTRQP